MAYCDELVNLTVLFESHSLPLWFTKQPGREKSVTLPRLTSPPSLAGGQDPPPHRPAWRHIKFVVVLKFCVESEKL